METDEEQICYPPWSKLPGLAIENIYSYLNRRDQKNMSLVCSNWRKEYSSPVLWRKVRFVFPDLENSTEVCPGVINARRFGVMFHHVEIVFNEDYREEETPTLPPKKVWRQLEYFLTAVTQHSQLISISFKNMFSYKVIIEDKYSADFYSAILNLVKSQKKLEYVEIRGCVFKHAEAGKFVKAIFENNSKTLKYLCLSEYFVDQASHPEFTNIAVNDNLNFRALMNLEVLSIDYTPVFENIVMSFYEYRNKVVMKRRNGRLKEIELIYKFFGTNHNSGINPKIWEYMRKIFPDLRVNLRLAYECNPENLSIFIVPNLPLRALEFDFKLFPTVNNTVGTLLHHITSCGINKSLEVLKLLSIGWCSTISTDLKNFMNLCPELKTLELDIGHPVIGLDSVFGSWLENRLPSLDTVNITIGFETSVDMHEEKMIYKNLIDLYAPLLLPLRISLSVMHF